jgi:hypothetical protein
MKGGLAIIVAAAVILSFCVLLLVEAIGALLQ